MRISDWSSDVCSSDLAPLVCDPSRALLPPCAGCRKTRKTVPAHNRPVPTERVEGLAHGLPSMMSVHIPPQGRQGPTILPEKGWIPSPTKSFPPPPLARPRRSAVPDPACARTSHFLLSFETTKPETPRFGKT